MKYRWLIGIALCAATAQAAAPPVATRMRNVHFHLGKGVELQVDDLVGRLVSLTAGPPVFDDVKKYRVDIDYARVSMTPESLSNLMNNYTFAYSGAPIEKLKIGIEGNELVQSGVLKKGVGIPFTMHATIAATPDGKIRIHPTSMKAAGFVSKRILDFFGLDLEKLVKVKPGTGVTVQEDDLLLDAEKLLPPPGIKGRLTKVWIENGSVVEQFGAPVKAPLTPPIKDAGNYMYYRGGVLRFGKLTMQDTDLLLVDENPKDAFDFSPERYNDQLVAGYSKNTPNHGLIVHMPDLRALSAAGNQRADQKPTERQHHQ